MKQRLPASLWGFTDYLLRLLRENLKLTPCRIDRAIARSIQQGQSLRFYRKDRTFKVNKLFII